MMISVNSLSSSVSVVSGSTTIDPDSLVEISDFNQTSRQRDSTQGLLGLRVTHCSMGLRKLRLIDWGLAEFYHPGKEYNVRVASRDLNFSRTCKIT
ncbi:unnamed protein product [Arabidopsis lyrata]|uniref:Protein kinase domain-containing protein n=1 Tax=Arabidopsis lyrata subsp. lyrata TaxID=81972 RepID=D7KLC6_ARALL|nr:hypothetical protein ARALYDRAFT_892439 [Arabidopsis lyrata subsp. lyrata]CAH8255587.1 unnamed protein product [Arabidopsis lyrata]